MSKCFSNIPWGESGGTCRFNQETFELELQFHNLLIGKMQYALVIAWFRVQYDQYFPSFSYFADLFH